MRDIENSKIYFRDFSDAPKSDIELHLSTAISFRNFDPPSYLVGLVLFKVMGFTKFRDTDKIHWFTKFKYKKFYFIIHDYKFGTWTIRAKNQDIEKNAKRVTELIGEIHTKVQKSAKYYNKILADLLFEQIEREEVFFNNVFDRLHRPFAFFNDKINEAIERRDKAKVEVIKETTSFGEVTTYLDHKILVGMEIEHYIFAQMNSFFSILEFLLDCFFAFERPKLTFKDFQKLYWMDKFKSIFNIEKGELKVLYDTLLIIKETYRNPLSHGLNNEVNFLVNIDGEGLVPINYEFMKNKPNFSLMTIPFEKCLLIQKTFNEIFSYFSKEKPLKYYFEFIKSNFPIPLEEKLIAEITSNRTSDDKWGKYLEYRTYMSDMIMNRDD